MKLLLLSALALLLTIACSPVLAQGDSSVIDPPRVSVNTMGGILTTGDPFLMIDWNQSLLEKTVRLEILDLWGKGRLGGLHNIPGQDKLYFHTEAAELRAAGCTAETNMGVLILTDFCLKRFKPGQRGAYPARFIQNGKTYEVRVFGTYRPAPAGKRWSNGGFISPLHRVTIRGKPGQVVSTPVGPIPPVNYNVSTPTPTPRPTATPWPPPTPRPPRPTNEIGLPPGYRPYVAPTKTPVPWPTATPWTPPTPTPAAVNRRYRVHGVDSTTADGLGQSIEAWLGGQQGYNLHSVVPVARDRVLVIVVRR